jgi:hypothetical protein
MSLVMGCDLCKYNSDLRDPLCLCLPLLVVDMSSTAPGMSSSRANHQATSKKRSRATSREGRQFNAHQAPQLPQLSGDVFLQFSTHKSLRQKDVLNDNERLIELGKSAFDLLLTLHLQKKRPMLKAKDVAVRRVWAQILCWKLTTCKQIQRELHYSSGMFRDWVHHYKLKVVCAKELQSTMSSDEVS